jgi:hypothetical protein
MLLMAWRRGVNMCARHWRQWTSLGYSQIKAASFFGRCGPRSFDARQAAPQSYELPFFQVRTISQISIRSNNLWASMCMRLLPFCRLAPVRSPTEPKLTAWDTHALSRLSTCSSPPVPHHHCSPRHCSRTPVRFTSSSCSRRQRAVTIFPAATDETGQVAGYLRAVICLFDGRHSGLEPEGGSA